MSPCNRRRLTNAAFSFVSVSVLHFVVIVVVVATVVSECKFQNVSIKMSSLSNNNSNCIIEILPAAPAGTLFSEVGFIFVEMISKNGSRVGEKDLGVVFE